MNAGDAALIGGGFAILVLTISLVANVIVRQANRIASLLDKRLCVVEARQDALATRVDSIHTAVVRIDERTSPHVGGSA